MERVPEPELMDDAAQAEAYAVADFASVNEAFVERFLAQFPELARGRILDLGCGPADICVRLAQALPQTQIVGLDGARAMLEEAERVVGAAGLRGRVELVEANLPEGLPAGPFDAVMSNSLLHHLHDPGVMWQAVLQAARPGAPVLVGDLMRPPDIDTARALVETYAADERPVLKEDFYNSLLAAFSVDEVEDQLERAGLGSLEVEVISDRHLMVSGRRPR